MSEEDAGGVYYIDVGNVSPKEAATIIRRWKKAKAAANNKKPGTCITCGERRRDCVCCRPGKDEQC